MGLDITLDKPPIIATGPIRKDLALAKDPFDGLNPLQTEALRALTKLGYIELLGPDKTDIVFDLEKFTSGKLAYDTVLRNEMGGIARQRSSSNALIPVMAQVFRGIKGFSKSDYATKRDTAETKPLFYLPDSAHDAQSVHRASSKDNYHLGLWELANTKYPATYPVAKGIPPSFDATVAHQLIWHPNYGNGYRKNGKLLVRHKGENHHRPITADFFAKSMKFRGVGNGLDRPVEFFFNHARSWTTLEGGNIDPLHDFKIMDGSATDRIYSVPRTVGKKGIPRYKIRISASR